MNNYLTTKELEQHIKDTYAKLKPYATKDGLYIPLETVFDTTTPRGFPGSFCYADDKGYHYGVINDRGVLSTKPITEDLSDITYQALENNIFWMSVEYERKRRVKRQDFRRIMFDKRLQYWKVIGDYYYERAKEEIAEVLQSSPFDDHQIPI